MATPLRAQHLQSRRGFLKQSSAAAAGLALTGPAYGRCPFGVSPEAAGIADRYTGLNSAKYLGEVRILAKVVDEQIFTERSGFTVAVH